MGRTHISRWLTKSGISSVDHLGELARYVLEADPVDISGTSGCSCLGHFSRNHEGFRTLTKGRSEVPFGT